MSKISLLIIVLLSFYACDESNNVKVKKFQEFALNDALNSVPEAYKKYLQCYALPQHEKDNCVSQLNIKYTRKELQNNHHYMKAFQYEAEKLGFKVFIQEHNLKCDHIQISPKYIDQVKAYRITCHKGNNYLMKFDYSNKQWSLIYF